MILERQIHKIHPGCWKAITAFDKKFDAYELDHGWPEKHRLQQYMYGTGLNTLIVMREWPSFADWETHMMPALTDPNYTKLNDVTYDLVDSVQFEAYICLPGPEVSPDLILERQIRQIHPGCWEALEAMEQRRTAYEIAHDWPAKRHYRLYLGGNSLNTLIVEREWPSFAEWEKRVAELKQDPEVNSLDAGECDPIDNLQIEAYIRLS